MTDFDPYKVLGIARKADLAAIKKAFRAASKRTHPDAGGRVEDFVAARRAYGILADAKKRTAYDVHGILDEETELRFESAVTSALGGLFEAYVRNGAAFRRDLDIIVVMRSQVADSLEKLKERDDAECEIEKAFSGLRGRISRADGANLFGAMIDNRISHAAQNRAKIDFERRVMEAVARELEAYSCATEIVARVSGWQTLNASTTSSATGAI